MTGTLAYSATFILGLLHAFEPGHGKSILAAFSLRKTNLKIFTSLILSLFISHFLVLGLFAFGLQKLASTELLEEYSSYLQLFTPILLVGYGGYLFYQAKKHRKTKTGGCSCGHDHSNDTLSNLKSASITGFIAGLMPCPTAIAPLILSGLHDGFSYTLVHIFVYVTGMALALFVFTGLLLIMKSFFEKKIKSIETKINLNYLSAIIMMGIGIAYFMFNVVAQDTHLHF